MDYYDQQEAQAEAACLHTAQKNGHTGVEAQLCDDGSVGCPDCPFVRVLTPRAADLATCLECGADLASGHYLICSQSEQ